jgi:hypothetical protein
MGWWLIKEVKSIGSFEKGVFFTVRVVYWVGEVTRKVEASKERFVDVMLLYRGGDSWLVHYDWICHLPPGQCTWHLPIGALLNLLTQSSLTWESLHHPFQPRLLEYWFKKSEFTMTNDALGGLVPACVLIGQDMFR